MSESNRLTFKLLSIFLQYPDERLQGSLAHMEEFRAMLPEKSSVILGRFLDWLRNTSLLQAQEHYTQTFDLSPQTCLYLTWRRWSDGKERGQELTRLLQAYRDGGFECVSKDLPDYLPMVLEFSSACPDDSGLGLLREFGPEIEKLHVDLRKSESPYADLLLLLTETVAAPRAEDTKERR
ncbi:MAG: nitrate reductase molybdenum cofactor assembly chaperone [Syntrophobacteraceae bacterium]|nr:nitrate reductase molybdenum cofactor assembly chaperone [Syntrophobacteraceae bacterium]